MINALYRQYCVLNAQKKLCSALLSGSEPVVLLNTDTRGECLQQDILDGFVNKQNLKKTGNNEVWLDKQLHAQGYHNAKEIYPGAVNAAENTLSLYQIDVKNNSADLFE